MKRRAFTLLELMIASAIFVVVMVLTTGIFSIASSYNGKLREMRTLSLTGRSVMEQLSTDVRLANGSANRLYDSNVSANKDIDGLLGTIGEITLFVCQNDLTMVCWDSIGTQGTNVRNVISSDLENWFSVASTKNGRSEGLNNSLFVIQKSKYKVIFYRTAIRATQPAWVLLRYERTYTAATWPNEFTLYDIQKDDYKTFDNRDNTQYNIFLNFQGYGPKKDSTRLMQPYVEAALRARTLNYDNLPANARASFDLKTSIETRDYN